MKTLLLIACAVTAVGSATTNVNACALKLPTFEVTGFPISAHQVAVLGSGHVEERGATPTLTLADMPASPHQIAVLARHVKTVQMADASGESVGHTDLSSKTRSPTDAAGLCGPD
jgi:hypothetical protein